jgi:hypothetical protein
MFCIHRCWPWPGSLLISDKHTQDCPAPRQLLHRQRRNVGLEGGDMLVRRAFQNRQVRLF